MQRFTARKEQAFEENGYVYAFMDLFQAHVGDEGYYAVSSDFDRHSGFLTYFTERADFDIRPEVNLCNFFVVQRNGNTQLAVVTGMPFVYQIRIRKCGDTYAIGLSYDMNFYSISEDIVIEVYDLPEGSGWFEAAKLYRDLQLKQGNVLRLADRLPESETLRYLVDAPEIRVRMGWKPAPPEVLEQTVENEPEMFAACSFDTVKKLVAELKKQGIEKAEICLVGWNKSGHDGRWPTALPVEEKLGGEEKLRELIAFAKENGYKLTGHTNALDCYSISNKWNDGEIVIKKKNGSLRDNGYGWSGGMMYWTCPKRAKDLAAEMFDEIAPLGFEGALYSDVMTIVKPRECFDPEHPVTSRACVSYWSDIMKMAADRFGGFQSEGAFDHCLRYLDYALYLRFNRARLDCMDEGIPLWETVYHDIVMANPGTNTINYTCADADTRLQMIELCGRPAFYYYTAFMKVTSWGSLKSREVFVMNSDEDIVKTAALIREGYDEYLSYHDLLTEEIVSYRKLSGSDVTETTYESGTKVIVNYLDSDFVCEDGTVVKAKDYRIVRP